MNYEHLTQNENGEKLAHPERVVGKFGVGLKDALATFDRHGINVLIQSRHGEYTIRKSPKSGFANVVTLHVVVRPPIDPMFDGTSVTLKRVRDQDMEMAKGFFRKYSDETVLEETKFGTIMRRKSNQLARIYVNGLRVAEEDNFLFSYDITSLTASLRKALNRERTNVGRSAYTDRIKTILMSSSSTSVAQTLASDLEGYSTGNVHDETQWSDVAIHASRILSAKQDVVFVTSSQLVAGGSMITRAQDDGHRVIVVPETLASRLPQVMDLAGKPIRDLSVYRQEWNDSFKFRLVRLDQLTLHERNVFSITDDVLDLVARNIRPVTVEISETMRLDQTGSEAAGLWQAAERRIVIKRLSTAIP